MPNRQRHRGRHPEDDASFGSVWTGVLREAVADVSYLLTSGYSEKAAVKFVGDRYQLTARQRRAVNGAACSDQSLNRRVSHIVQLPGLRGCDVAIDGYNLLITSESILAGGLLFKGRDGCVRDLASVHGSYHRVEETGPAIGLIGRILGLYESARATWYLDAPVSNSGRLRAILYEEAEKNEWDWQVEVTNGVDRVVAESEAVVLTSDSWILDRAGRWANLAESMVKEVVPAPGVLNLGSR